MTLKYPKKATQKRKEKTISSPSDLPQYSESWINHHQPQNCQSSYQVIHEYTPQYVDQSQYSPDYYSYTTTTPRAPNKSPLLAQSNNHQQPQQILSPGEQPATNHHLMETTCDWSASTNHESAAKPVASGPQWTTEFTYIDAKAEQQQQQLCSPNNGGSLHQPTTELMPEFINFCEYDQQTGFPPSISSNASTLSSPTTSSDYNFNYQFDTLNTSLSNDGFDAMYQPQQQQPQLIDSYTTYETGITMVDAGIYSTEYSTSPENSHWTTTDISNIPYEPNYYPFATEKMMIY